MAIRIDHIRSGSNSVVYIAGRLSGPAVAQLNKTCDPIAGPLVIDLSDLIYADEEGLNAIRAIVGKGAKVHGASPFVDLLLDHPKRAKRKRRYPDRDVLF